jgi:hypothetical protein
MHLEITQVAVFYRVAAKLFFLLMVFLYEINDSEE